MWAGAIALLVGVLAATLAQASPGPGPTTGPVTNWWVVLATAIGALIVAGASVLYLYRRFTRGGDRPPPRDPFGPAGSG